jgi:YidC/Oxa1 family membrane protein insertase
MREAVKANPQMALMKYLSPIMMAVFSIGSPAAIPLYWIVGSLFMILQQFVLKMMKKNKNTFVEETMN